MVWLKRDAIRRGARRPPQPDEQADHPAPDRSPEPLPVAPPLGVHTPAEGSPDPLQKLRKLVEEGHFPTGSRLPPERALAAQLGVGRPALREAIKVLSAMGVLESRQGSGTYVKSREPLASPPSLPPTSEAVEFEILDLLEARKILEPRAAWLAATRAAERHLREIEAARQKLELHAQDWRLVARLDHELHAAIIRGAQNPVLDQIGRILTSHVFENRSLTARFAPDVERMRREHSAIVDAILKRQADSAEQAMMKHLNSAGLDFISEASP